MDVVAIATITPLRLRAGIEGRGRCVPVVFSLEYHHLQVESHITYLYICDVLYSIMLFLVFGPIVDHKAKT